MIAVLKKVKHRVVESMNANTADALGLSRAILCNGKLPGSVFIDHSKKHTLCFSSIFCKFESYATSDWLMV